MVEAGNIQLSMLAMLVIWIWLVVVIVKRTIARGSVGLPAAMALTMTFLYGGCFVYAVPGYTHLRTGTNAYLLHFGFTEAAVLKGTFASLLGLLGLTLGSGNFFRFGPPKPSRRIAPAPIDRQSEQNERSLLVVLGMIALLSYALHLSDIRFPMSGAILEAGRNLALAVIGLGGFFAVRHGKSLAKWYIAGALPTAYYLFGFGFMATGFLSAMVLVGFWLAQLKKNSWQARWTRLLLMPAIFLGMLSLFVSWMSFRDIIRHIVWLDGSGSSLEAVFYAFSNTRLFSIWDFEALDLVNIRLNLPLFIGQMIEQHQVHPELRQYGATLITLPLVFLPRVFWPGKPERGGSDFMSQHSGVSFSDGTTFGTGTVFEFYVNFGYVGVFLGFILFGMFLARLDRAAARHLNTGHYLKFARLFVVGVVAIDPLLRPFFIVNGMVVGWILMSLLIFVVGRRPSRAHRVIPFTYHGHR